MDALNFAYRGRLGETSSLAMARFMLIQPTNRRRINDLDRLYGKPRD